jgi:hypothetical protein
MAIKIHQIMWIGAKKYSADKSNKYREIQITAKCRKTVQICEGFPMLKNSNFCVDHNSEDRWQPRWKSSLGVRLTDWLCRL